LPVSAVKPQDSLLNPFC